MLFFAFRLLPRSGGDSADSLNVVVVFIATSLNSVLQRYLQVIPIWSPSATAGMGY